MLDDVLVKCKWIPPTWNEYNGIKIKNHGAKHEQGVHQLASHYMVQGSNFETEVKLRLENWTEDHVMASDLVKNLAVEEKLPTFRSNFGGIGLCLASK